MPRRDFGYWSLQNRRSVYLVEWLVRASPEEIFLDMGITNLKVSQKGDWWLGWGFSGGRTWAGHVHRSTHDWWLTWGQMQKNRRKTEFRNQKKENKHKWMWKKTKVPFQRSWLTFWQNVRVSRFFLRWPSRVRTSREDHATSTVLFFSPVDYYSFFFFFSESLFWRKTVRIHYIHRVYAFCRSMQIVLRAFKLTV
jgi:hypothetical protein